MRDLALVMVKPDGVHQNLMGAVLTFLADRGFHPLSAVTLGLTPALRSRLYATTRAAGHLDWDLNAVLYTLGPVTAVLLRGRPGAAAYLSSGLRRAAFEAVRQARDRLVAACGEPAMAAGLPALLAGRPVRLPLAAGAGPRWNSYLACTTLRYVDLCLSPTGTA